MIVLALSDPDGLGPFVIDATSLADAADQIRARYAALGDGFGGPAEIAVLLPQFTATITPGNPPTLVFAGAAENQRVIVQKAQAALAANEAYLNHASIPAGTLTALQLSGIARLLSDQVDALTKQVSGLERIATGQLDSTAGTGAN